MLNSIAAMVTILLFFAFLVERLVEWLTKLVPWLDTVQVKQVNLQMVLAVLFSMVLAFGAKLDFFVMMGIEFYWPYAGIILTAIIMSGGSNFVHDIVGWVEAKKDTAKVEREERYEYLTMLNECNCEGDKK